MGRSAVYSAATGIAGSSPVSLSGSKDVGTRDSVSRRACICSRRMRSSSRLLRLRRSSCSISSSTSARSASPLSRLRLARCHKMMLTIPPTPSTMHTAPAMNSVRPTPLSAFSSLKNDSAPLLSSPAVSVVPSVVSTVSVLSVVSAVSASSAKVSGAHSAAPSKTAAKTANIRLEKVFLIIHFLFRDNLCVTISNSFLFSLAYFAWCFNGKINKPAASLHGSCSRNGGYCVYLYFFRNRSSLQCTLQARRSSHAPAPCCHGRER